MLWLNETNKIIMENRKIIDCKECPCDCEVFKIATAITNRYNGLVKWDLKPYKFSGKYSPRARWRLRDVGEAHYHDNTKGCSGTIYDWGRISPENELIGLPEYFETRYSYNGYMLLEQGCYNSYTGYTEWTCP